MATSESLTEPDYPLCVDLDGTLLKSDLLHESVLTLIARNPLHAFLLPVWLLRGKAALKQKIADRVELDARLLPYDGRVVELLRDSGGRKRVLCTASDARYANAIADHLGLFDQVMASDGIRNLAGECKADALRSAFGDDGYDYAGNAEVDLDVWRHARKGWVVNASHKLAEKARGLCDVEVHLGAVKPNFRTWVKAIRLHQWLKNLLVLIPLLASHRLLDPTALAQSTVAFLAFGLCASGVYVLNDLLDLASDRQHPSKRNRPFASGSIPLAHGMLAAPLLTLAGFALALSVTPLFAGVLFVYYATTLGYSLAFKRMVMIDVVVLAGLYTIRIIGGAVAISSSLSFWLLAFSMFLFLSLAMLKRHTELASMLADGRKQASGRGYTVDDLALVQSLGGASGYLAVLVFALYINSPESLALYHHPKLLWLICPFLLYWISRMWIVAHRGRMDDDPVVFAVTDRGSLAVILACGLLVLAAI